MKKNYYLCWLVKDGIGKRKRRIEKSNIYNRYHEIYHKSMESAAEEYAELYWEDCGDEPWGKDLFVLVEYEGKETIFEVSAEEAITYHAIEARQRKKVKCVL